MLQGFTKVFNDISTVDIRNPLGYIIRVIKSFKHKGIEDFFHSGSKKGIIPEHAGKLARMLDRLDASIEPEDMDLPGYRLHPLIGREKGRWSVTVNGNWRITFEFIDQDAILVNYEDYH